MIDKRVRTRGALTLPYGLAMKDGMTVVSPSCQRYVVTVAKVLTSIVDAYTLSYELEEAGVIGHPEGGSVGQCCLKYARARFRIYGPYVSYPGK